MYGTNPGCSMCGLSMFVYTKIPPVKTGGMLCQKQLNSTKANFMLVR